MGAKYTEAQHQATNKWRLQKAQITITVEPEVRDKWKEKASDEGISLSQWIIKQVENSQ